MRSITKLVSSMVRREQITHHVFWNVPWSTNDHLINITTSQNTQTSFMEIHDWAMSSSCWTGRYSKHQQKNRLNVSVKSISSSSPIPNPTTVLGELVKKIVLSRLPLLFPFLNNYWDMSCGAARTHVSGGPETSGEPQSARQQRAEARPTARPDRVAKGWPWF